MAKKKDSKDIIKKLRNYAIVLIITLILIKINKTAFFFIFFSVVGFIGNWIRGQFGLKMVVLDPNLFFMILLVEYFGIPMLALFLFVNIFAADLITGIFSAGSFLNYVLYHVCPIVGFLIFGSLGIGIWGNIASLIYSVMYFIFRTKVLPDDPIQVISKSITSFVFTFLYIGFFGPLFNLILGG
jgi:hypothetical protein